MNAEDLNDICGRSVRGAPIDADHVLEIIADLTAARAELADVRAVLAAVDELGRGMSIGLSRAAEERDAALAAIARVQEVIACHSHDSAACDLLDDLDVALEGNGQG